MKNKKLLPIFSLPWSFWPLPLCCWWCARARFRLRLRAELIYGDNNTTMNLPLDVDETYDVDTGYYTVHIQIKDGAARFVDSPCPDHICEGFGWLSNEDQTATCLPARAVLTIVPVS